MSAHADVLDQAQPLTKPFWVSFTIHILVLGGLLSQYLIQPHHLNMGSPTGGGMGGLLVNPVNNIPLPNQSSRPNPVANPTKSEVPTPPPPKQKAKPIPKVKAPPEEAIPLKSDKALVKRHREVEPPPAVNRYREQQIDKPNQLYSESGQRASSPMYQMPGGGGVGIGDNSPFGEEFGTYANIIRDNIARNWKPLRTGSAQSVTVTFTIQRNGSISNVKILGSSGNPTLDFSAQRAVLNTQLPPLPDRFPRNQADVQMKFEVGN